MNRILRPTLSTLPFRKIAVFAMLYLSYFTLNAQIQITNCPGELLNLITDQNCEADYVLGESIQTTGAQGTVEVFFTLSGATGTSSLIPISVLENGYTMFYGVTQLTILARDVDEGGMILSQDQCDVALVVLEEIVIPADLCDDITVDIAGACMAEIILPDDVVIDEVLYCETGVVTISYDGNGSKTLIVTSDDLAIPPGHTIYISKTGNEAFCTRTITVIDSSVPSLDCPSSFAVEVAPGCEYIYNYDVAYSGSCSSELIQTSGGPSGESLGAGSYTYTYVVTDIDQFGSEIVVEECTWTLDIIESSEVSVQMNCLGSVNISIDENCEAYVDASMLLSGNNCTDLSLLTLRAVIPGGQVLQGSTIVFTDDNVGQSIDVSVTDPNGLNMCWGTVNIEDKSAPILICPSDVTILCTEPTDTVYNGSAFVLGSCDDATIYYRDSHQRNMCNTDYQEVIARTFYAVDGAGNMSFPCTQIIYILRESLDNAIYPEHYDGIEFHTGINDNGVGSNPPLACDGEGVVWNPEVRADGHVVPSPFPKLDNKGKVVLIGTGYPTGVGSCGTIHSFYDDILFDVCNDNCTSNKPSYKVLRTWDVFDWCTGQTVKHEQIIKVLDTVPPVFTIEVPDMTVSTDLWGCGATINLPTVAAVDQCSETVRYTWTVSGGTYDPINKRVYVSSEALTTPGNEIELIAAAEDCCGNIAYSVGLVTIIDDVPPVVVADEHTVVSLNNQSLDGNTKVYAYSFDDGSFDGCSEVDFWVRRMDTACPDFDGAPDTEINETKTFQKYIHFCCQDVGVERMVELLVCDDADGDGTPEMNGDDNCNTAMISVTTQDKLAPTIVCPAPAEINCIEFEVFEELIGKTLTEEDIELLNTTFGTAYSTTTCGSNIVQSISGSENCGTGKYTRTFSVTTSNGTATCTQTINVVTDLENELTCERITFPVGSPEYEAYKTYIGNKYGTTSQFYPDGVWCLMNPYFSGQPVTQGEDLPAIAVEGCGGVSITTPLIDIDNLCTEVGMNLSLDTFNFAGGGCQKILAHWEIIDQCIFVDNFLVNGRIDPFVPENGYFEMYVEYDIFDSEGPVVDCAAQTIATTDCEFSYGTFSVSVSDNCTPADIIGITFKVDIGADGVFDYPTNGSFAEGNSFDATLVGGLGIGNHEIKWVTTDGCGNYTVCSQTITVTKQVKEPTPYCHLGLSSATMDAQYGCSVEVWALDFVAGGFDDCDTELTYTMIPYFDIYGDPKDEADDLDVAEAFAASEAGWEFGCAYIENGEAHVIEIRIYAVDEDGNYDYCDASLTLNDNFDCCDDLFGASTLIEGKVATEEGVALENVRVDVMTSAPEFPRVKNTNENGSFMFQDLPYNMNYELSAKNNSNTKEGVSTLDLVLIQRHILGISQLDSPFKIIAADINNSGNISASDLLQLRKLILGLYVNDELPSNTSWRFVDNKYSFIDPNNPFPYNEVIGINNLAQAMYNQNFVAVKIGDVNSSVSASLRGDATVRSNEAIQLSMQDQDFEAGKSLQIDVTAEALVEIFGLQMEIEFDQKALEFKGVSSEIITISDQNTAVKNNSLLLSWNEADLQSINKDEVIFTLSFNTKTSGTVSNSFAIADRLLQSEAYNSKLESTMVNLEFRSAEFTGFELYQNEPNPFQNVTTITFDLPEAGRANLKVFDVTGRLIVDQSNDFAKGLNKVILNKSELGASGVMYYQLTFGNDSATRKMILLD